MDYDEFLTRKMTPQQFDSVDRVIDDSALFHYQNDLVNWSLSRGRSCIFADCGLGKSAMQLKWAQQVNEHSGKPVLILAPLGAAKQTARTESEKFDVPVTFVSDDSEVTGGVNITNYEKLKKFDVSKFDGVVLDEASIIKAYDGKLRNAILAGFESAKYKLSCTATPSPNETTELGNQSQFLGIMSHAEMLAMYFINDMGQSAKWRIKKHAEIEFWRWVCTWAMIVRSPSDLGYSDEGFVLPGLERRVHTIASDWRPDGALFASEVMSLSERRAARRASISDRVAISKEIADADDTQFVVWCDLNDESAAITKQIPGAVEVKGSDSAEHKESAMLGFANGDFKVLVTKPKIAAFGMNWQNCHRTIFCGMSDSWERFYQCIRRFHRYGQKHDVMVDVVVSEQELPVLDNIERKERQSNQMFEQVRPYIQDEIKKQIKGQKMNKTTYIEKHEQGERWELHLGDCVEVTGNMDDDSVDYSVFSPPFASLYTYSSSDRDMGNCVKDEDFSEHFQYLVANLYRIIKPGRLVSFHCMNLPTSKVRDGYIGLKDFRGELIKAFEREGFIFHSEVCIWKDPVVAMQRTKALGLLHKQIKKDSCMSRQGVPDYLVTMRKPGDNFEPVSHTDETFPVQEWQRIASPIWTDINPSDTLQYRSARDEKDEKHICPLQIEVIRRALKLWSNPDDLVLTPFAGIGSELYVALEQGRRAVGVELKESYFKQAVLNCISAENSKQQKLELA